MIDVPAAALHPHPAQREVTETGGREGRRESQEIWTYNEIHDEEREEENWRYYVAFTRKGTSF